MACRLDSAIQSAGRPAGAEVTGIRSAHQGPVVVAGSRATVAASSGTGRRRIRPPGVRTPRLSDAPVLQWPSPLMQGPFACRRRVETVHSRLPIRVIEQDHKAVPQVLVVAPWGPHSTPADRNCAARFGRSVTPEPRLLISRPSIATVSHRSLCGRCSYECHTDCRHPGSQPDEQTAVSPTLSAVGAFAEHQHDSTASSRLRIASSCTYGMVLALRSGPGSSLAGAVGEYLASDSA